MTDASGYGLWFFALLNAAIFIMFAFSFFKPKTPRDWRSFGAFSAFLVSAYDLPIVRLVANDLSGHRLVLARRGPLAGNDVRLENKSPFWSFPHDQLYSDWSWILDDLHGVAGSLSSPT